MNMKWLATAASAAVATVVIVPNWGLAGDAVHVSVTATGHVDASCNWLGGKVSNVEFGDFVDANSRIIEQPYSLGLGNIRCNQVASVKLTTKSGGMKSKDTASCAGGGNSHCVNYLATADWIDASITYETNGTANGTAISDKSTTVGDHAVQLTVTPKKPAGDVPLIAGEFTDTLTVQVTPN